MSSSNLLTVSVGAKSHAGNRPDNQDRISRADTPFGDLYIVADGVGGYRGGGQAAQVVVDGFARYLKENGELPLTDVLQKAARSISSDLCARSNTAGPERSMISTVVLAVVRGNKVVIAHAGDSRAYKLTGGRLERLTRDHSVVERLIAEGKVLPEQAKSRSDASVLTRAIGQSADILLEIGETTVQPGDALLLCSDGLWGYASDRDIQAVAGSPNLSAKRVAEALLALAMHGGGGDNISVQLIRFESQPEFAAGPRRSISRHQALIVSAGLAAGLALTGGWMAIANALRPVRTGSISSSSTATPRSATPAAPPPQAAVDNSLPSDGGMPSPTRASAVPPGAGASPDSKAVVAKPAAVRKTPIVIMTQEAEDEPQWIRTLAARPDVEARRAAPNASCIALGGNSPALAASPAGAAEADALRQKLGLADTELIQLSAGKLKVCGEGGIFVLPARSTLLDKARKELQRLDPRKMQ